MKIVEGQFLILNGHKIGQIKKGLIRIDIANLRFADFKGKIQIREKGLLKYEVEV